MVLIAVKNESTLNDTDVATMCAAIQKQITLHVAPAWDGRTCTVKFYASGKKIPGYAWVVSVLNDSTQAGALGYHSEDNDAIDAFIFIKPVLDNGGVVLYDSKNPQNVSVSSVLSHEIVEMFGDRFANTYCDDGSKTWALELCDPVEGNSYSISVNGVMVSLSDFVFPNFFNPEAIASVNMPFNYMKTLTKPFVLDKGGYAIVRTGGPGTEKQIFGEEMLVWKKEMKQTDFSRASKRAVKGN